MIFDHAPDAVAVYDGRSSLTWAELDREAAWWATAALMSTQPGDRVLFKSGTHPAGAAMLLGLLCSGRTVVPAPPRATGAELAALAAFYGTSAVFDGDESAIPDFEGSGPWASIPARLPEGDGVSLILHSSGTTTGKPKGCEITADAVRAYAATGWVWGFQPGDVYLMPLPLGVAGGFVGTMLPALASGAAVRTMAAWDPVEWARITAEEPVTTAIGVPAMFRDALPHTQGGSLRAAFSGAAPTPPALAEAFAAVYGTPLVDVYACSEHGVVALDGVPLPDLDWSVDGGELLVSGPRSMRGYHGIPGPSRGTGDTVEVDGGRIRVAGRVDDVVNVGGLKCQPDEVDAALLAAGIDGVAAGVPDDRLGQVVAVFTTSEVPLADVQAACAQLAPHKVPRRVVRVPDLPYSPVGKLQRRLLR